MSNEHEIAAVLLDSIDWSCLTVCGDKAADDVPRAFRALLDSQNSTQAEQAYWRIDNNVVVQGNVYDSAPAAVAVILSALTDFQRPIHVQVCLLELLAQIVFGSVSGIEEVPSDCQLEHACLEAAREGIWTLYKLVSCFATKHREIAEAALDVLEKLDTNQVRFQAVATAYKLSADDRR